MSNSRGFTLIELLIVTAILGVIGLYSIPTFTNMIEKQRSRSASYELYHHLNFARSQAISRNSAITVCASIDGNTCTHDKDWSNKTLLIFSDSNQNGEVDENDNILKTRKFSYEAGSLMWRSFRNKGFLQWFPTGITYYQNGNFVYCPTSKNPRNARNLIMNAAGRVYFGRDRNGDGIPEGSNGKNISC